MQKKIAFLGLLTAILSIPSVGISQSPMHWEPTLDTAQRAAGQTNRLVLIYFWAPWCTVCRHMEAEALAQPGVTAEITANYVPVKVDADNFPATARQYGVAALPTTVITTPQGQLLVSMQGRMEAAEYAARLAQIAAGAKQRGTVYAQVPAASMPANNVPPAITSATPPMTAAMTAPPPASPSGAPATTPPATSAAGGPALTGAAPPAATSGTPAGTRTGLSDDRYANYFRGSQAAPATPITQPPSSLAAAANTQLPPPPGPAAPGVTPTANMPPPPSMPSTMPASTKDLAQGFPPSQASAPTLPVGPSPALAATAPSYGAQPPLMPTQPTASSPPPAAPGAPPLPAINPPVGLDGYCPVTLSERQQWVPGDRHWGAIHRDRTYLFAGPEEQRRFFTDPDRYAPAAAGNDVVLASEQGQAVPGMRQHGVYFGNPSRVYLFTSEATLERFTKNPNLYINQAWGSLRAGTYGGQQQMR
jgi:thiol-disulfide isomerase/thioredoxin/YHS domain-containing protein